MAVGRHKKNMDLTNKQKSICHKYNAKFWALSENLKVGISTNVKLGIEPINGLRILPEGDTTGWYIWAGEELLQDDDFFLPLHVEHIKDWCPKVLKFLGLPPGYRFLIANNYEDVWYDASLLCPENTEDA
jgi:hypothetical protein